MKEKCIGCEVILTEENRSQTILVNYNFTHPNPEVIGICMGTYCQTCADDILVDDEPLVEELIE